MRKLYSYLACIILASTLSSCTQDLTEDIQVNISNGETIYAKMKELDRAQLSTGMKMTWNEKDTIYVIGPDRFCGYTFDGKTGARGGSFTAIPELNLYENNVTYKTIVNNLAWDKYYGNKYYAICPYGSLKMVSDEIILYTKRKGTAIQQYTPTGCDPSACMMYGVSDDGTNFVFSNIMGFLHVKLTGSKKVKNIVLSECTGVEIAGCNGLWLDAPHDYIVWNTAVPKSSTITLDCGDGVQLGDTPTDFIFAIIPCVMAEGFVLQVNFTDGSTFVQATNKKIEIAYNTVQPMTTIHTDGIEYQSISVVYSGTTAILPEFIGSTSVSGYVDWGDGNNSVLRLVTTYDYTDGASSHSATINVRNADKVKFSNIYGVTELDLSNF